MKIPVVVIKQGRDYPIRRGHPWVFSGAIDRKDAGLIDGDLVEVQAVNGEFLAIAHYAPTSLALKILSRRKRTIDAQFWRDTIGAACARREMLGLFAHPDIDAFRLVNAEGDGLPGLIVDLYGSTAVVQCHTAGMWRLRNDIAQAIAAVLGQRVTAIYDKSELPQHETTDTVQNSYLLGTRGDGLIVENGLRYAVDWEAGQKTGFFLDQRENRALLRRFAAGRDVLNAFCYTGGFSMSALAGSAKSVESLDASQSALDLVERNLALNDFGARAHRTVKADFMDYMRGIDGRFDLIVLDPPAFAKKRSAIDGACRGYRRINQRAAEALRPGGLLWTFSCSQAIGRDLFRETIADAIADGGRRGRILFELHQAPCHMLSVAHPEGEYLKGLVICVE